MNSHLIKGLILTVTLAAAVRGAEPAPALAGGGGMLNLSCVEALVAIEQPGLAGVFSFIAEKDSPAAFADLAAHHPKALKKYLAKVEKDFKAAAGVTSWDHEVLSFLVSLYSGPLASTLEKTTEKQRERITALSVAPTLSLEQVTAGRKK